MSNPITRFELYSPATEKILAQVDLTLMTDTETRKMLIGMGDLIGQLQARIVVLESLLRDAKAQADIVGS